LASLKKKEGEKPEAEEPPSQTREKRESYFGPSFFFITEQQHTEMKVMAAHSKGAKDKGFRQSTEPL